LYRILLLLPLLLLAVGCKTRVAFPLGAPYPSTQRIDEAVIISFPDSIIKRTYNVKVGGFLDQHVFVMPVFDIYRSETVARMNGLFAKGVTLVAHSALDEMVDRDLSHMRPEPAPDSRDHTQSASNLESVLADLERREGGDRSVGKSRQELMDEALREAAMESIDDKNAVYLLYFRDALYGVEDSRITVRFRAQLIDRRTGATLLDNRYQGRSTRFDPVNNLKTNEIRLVSLTRLAFSGAMSKLIDDIAQATGNWTPRK
jgi:predicted ATP-dependent endonuclease of OLD family